MWENTVIYHPDWEHLANAAGHFNSDLKSFTTSIVGWHNKKYYIIDVILILMK